MILLSRKKNLYVDAEEQSLQVSEVELYLILFYLLFVFFYGFNLLVLYVRWHHC